MPSIKVPQLIERNNKQNKFEQQLEKRVSRKAYRQSSVFMARNYASIRRASLLSGLCVLSGIPLFLLLSLRFGQTWLYLLLPFALYLIFAATSFLVVDPLNKPRIKAASYLLVAGVFAASISLQYIAGSNNSSMLGYGLVLVISALAGLSFIEITIFSVLSFLAATFMSFAENIANIYNPVINIYDETWTQTFITGFLIAMLAAGIIMLVQSLYESLVDSEQRAKQFLETTQLLTQTNQFGRQVSTSLSSIVSELSANSRQQATGAQEQAAAVMEVTSSLTELGETARQIASNTSRVSSASSDGLVNATQVRESTRRATNTAERGQAAVDSSIQAIEDVRNGITGLAERLMTLTDRSKQISSIIALIKEISDETHLLALNAAIESAGAGENGRRFSVVATQVKSLADRSLEATSEVSQVINELQGAVAASVLASEETRKKTFGAVERSYQAGQVISELGQVVDETASNSAQIVESMQQVAILAEEISLATQQQESASRQIISTMEAVGMVAQENASAVTQVSETVIRIDHLSNQLSQALISKETELAVA